jgi:succinate-semialdehyde dehydrogenase/glutarate-semialdehyde dehydrogenase
VVTETPASLATSRIVFIIPILWYRFQLPANTRLFTSIEGLCLMVSPIVDGVEKSLLIGGEWAPALSGRTFEVQNPATGFAVAEFHDAGIDDGMLALDAAASSQARWESTSTRERSSILRRVSEFIARDKDLLSTLISLETGKPLSEAQGEVDISADYFLWYSELVAHGVGSYATSPSGAMRLITTTRAIGPALLVTPWNFPLSMAARKVSAALAAGCTFILKPDSLTPFSTTALGTILVEAGLPSGVGSVLPTSDPGSLIEPLLLDGRIRKLSFTGSTAVGKLLARQASHQLVRPSLELGGNAPFIVFSDADLGEAIDHAVLAKMRNAGQTCISANRFLVHSSVAEQFTQELSARLVALSLGGGLEPSAQVGPVISPRQRDRIHGLVTEAVERGATLHTGGAAPDREGYFYSPTVISDLAVGSRLLQEEIFGPVATVATFEHDDEAVERANDTAYGLASYVFTRDISRALRAAERLTTGMTAINTSLIANPAAPFGGNHASGYGREGGTEGLEEYLTTKFIATPV